MKTFRALVLAAATAFTWTAAAHADTIFTFTPSGGSAITFTLAASPYTRNDGYNTNFLVNQPSSIRQADFFSDAYGNFLLQYGYGHVDLQLEFANGTNYGLDGPQLYTGPESAPVFTPGTYNLTSDPQIGNGGGTLVISNNAVAVTPEPSSLLLLGTGITGALCATRRRLRRA